MDDTKIYQNPLRGVGCEVSECKYNCAGSSCTASKITVESKAAENKTDTFCGTFTAKTC